MNTKLAESMYNHIGKITHLRTFEFLKAIAENIDEDGYSRITYARWRDEFRLHAWILNACTEECERLGFIEVYRENKEGIAKEGGGKGTRRIYKLTLDNVGNAEGAKPEVKDDSAPVPKVPAKKTVKKAVKKASPKKPASSKKNAPVPKKKRVVKKAVKKVVKKKSK